MIIGVIAIGIVAVIVCAALVLMAHLYKLYNCHECKHCGHYMTYKGTHAREDGNICLFHCKNCGVWEEVPISEIVKTL